MSVPFDAKALADELRDALLADPFFAAIPSLGAGVVVTEDPQDVATNLQEAINQIGIGLMVMLPDLTSTEGDVPGPYYDDVRGVIVIAENPTLNRSKGNPTAYQCSVQAARVLHLNPNLSDLVRVPYDRTVRNPDFNTRNIGYITQAGLGSPRTPIGPVVATPASGPGPVAVALSCATPGAPIWYTLDGTYPSPLNPTAKNYLPYAVGLATESGQMLLTEGGSVIATDQGPGVQSLVIAAGTTLCARAWLAGYAPASPPQLTLNY